jgi:Fur family ferric uptake transcriptional regulator
VSDVEQLLRQHGLQVTAPRMAVMSAVTTRPHATADDLIDDVRERIGTGSAARYESRTGDNHHHLICRSCRTMFDIDCAVGYTPCLTAADDHGFEIDEAEVVYWGRCPECRAADSAT